MDKETIQKMVKDAYGKVAQKQEGCGCGSSCGPHPKEFARSIGYSEEELQFIPHEANLALSCGNPTALAQIKEGDIVLDLGSGAGFDCFLAASKVGTHGKVIGVDMTPEMIEKAKANAQKQGTTNVEFRLGEIEHLPLADHSVDVVISNCVINLSADKAKVFQEIYRVLKPGGKLAISDMALLKKLPSHIEENIAAYVGCVSGAVLIDEYKKMVQASGLERVNVTVKSYSACSEPYTRDPLGRVMVEGLDKEESIRNYVVSIDVEAYKCVK